MASGPTFDYLTVPLGLVDAIYQQIVERFASAIRRAKITRPKQEQGRYSNEAVFTYLLACRELTTAHLRRKIRLKSWSPYRWLWYLRRTNKVFEGDLTSTWGYDLLLAGVLSSSARFHDTAAWEQDAVVTFPMDPPAVHAALEFAASARYISEIHQAIRWSGKNVDFEWSAATQLFSPLPKAEEQAAVRLYDERFARSGRFFSRLGTSIDRPFDDLIKDLHKGDASLLADAEIVALLGADTDGFHFFIPHPMRLNELAELQAQPAMEMYDWSQGHAAALLLLHAVLPALFYRYPGCLELQS